MEVTDIGRNFDTSFLFSIFLLFNIFNLIEQDVHHLIDLVDQFGFPSTPKREIVEI